MELSRVQKKKKNLAFPLEIEGERDREIERESGGDGTPLSETLK